MLGMRTLATRQCVLIKLSLINVHMHRDGRKRVRERERVGGRGMDEILGLVFT